MIERIQSGSAVERLAAATRFIDGAPRDAEVLLVGASRGAIDDLVRAVARRRGATFGLHRFTLTQLAARLAAPALSASGAAPCTALGAHAVAARAVHELRGSGRIPYFAPVAAAPGFTRSLAATLTELRAAGVDPAGLAAAPPPAPELGALLAAYERWLDAARLADRAALLRAATAAVGAADRDPLLGLPVLLLDVPVETPLERNFAEALIAAADHALICEPAGTIDGLVACGDGAAATVPPATSLARLQTYLFADADPPDAARDESVELFSAPGEGREAVEIARRMLAAARDGVPFDHMAVVLRSPESYGALLEAALRRAGIPAWFARGTRRPNPAGRAVLALLDCAAERLSARRFAEYLSLGEVPRPDDPAREWTPPRDDTLALVAPVDGLAAAAPDDQDEAHRGKPSATPPAPWRWESLLVEAAVIGGADRWRRRLDGFDRELAMRAEELRAAEPDAPRLAGIERTRAQLTALRGFALPIVERLAAFPDRAVWGEWLERIDALAGQVLRNPAPVRALIAELAPMAEVGPVGLDEVRDVLAERLTTLTADPPADRYGRVLITTVDDMRGRCLDLVFVPGLAERMFPQRPREDPLLLDGLRGSLGPHLATQAERGLRERLRLRLAVGAAARRVVLSYPRADVTQGRPRVISFYGLDVARATRGAIPDVEGFEREATTSGNARLAWPAPPEPAAAIDAAEHDLATLAALLRLDPRARPRGGAQYLLDLNPHLARSLRLRYARWEQPRWSPLDGVTRASELSQTLLDQHRLRARRYSPSALERYARCPYQFFLAAIQKLSPRDEAAPLEQLDPLTRGRVIHRVQAETLRALIAAGLRLTSATLAEAERLLLAALERVGEQTAEDLAPPIPRVWQDELAALRGDLLTWIRMMAERGGDWQPAFVELAIGLDPDAAHDPASLPEPARVGDGFLLRGAIDLIERRGDGALRVIDHKTGREDVTAGLVVGHGEKLQPALYALSVEAAMGARVQDSRLSFCTARGGFAEHVVPFDVRVRTAALEVLNAIDRAVAAGHFHPAPRRDACGRCDFRPVCGPYEEERAADKDPLPDLAALRARP